MTKDLLYYLPDKKQTNPMILTAVKSKKPYWFLFNVISVFIPLVNACFRIQFFTGIKKMTSPSDFWLIYSWIHTHTYLCKYYISVYNYEDYSIALYQNKVFDKNHGLIVQYCKYHNRFTTRGRTQRDNRIPTSIFNTILITNEKGGRGMQCHSGLQSNTSTWC